MKKHILIPMSLLQQDSYLQLGGLWLSFIYDLFFASALNDNYYSSVNMKYMSTVFVYTILYTVL